MSVFDLPRLHFAGVATTRLPTGPRSGLNDLATNTALTDDGPAPAPFPADRPAAEYHAWLHRRGPRFDGAGRPCADGAFSAPMGWNFDGNGHFLLDARVTAVEGPDGRTDTADPLVGRSVDVWGHYNPYLRTTVNRARVFDLDPASRWTMALMCGRFCFGRLGRSHDDGYLFTGGVTGFQPPRWTSFARIADVGGHALADWLRHSAVHQFVVTRDEAEWLDGIDSPAARALRAAVENRAEDGAEDRADGIVVRLALDNMASPIAPDTPGRWRVRGTVAPWHADELRTYPAGRLLVPVPGSPLRHLTADVREGRAALDMITAVPVTGRAADAGPGPLHRLGPPLDAGPLELRTTAGTLVARVPAGAYPSDATCGIVTVPAPGWRAAGDAALCLTGTGADGRTRTLLTEREAVVQSDDALVVLHHRDRARGEDHAVRVPLRSFVRGRPASVGVRVRQYHNPRALPADPVAGAPGARCGDAVVLGVRAPDGEAYAPECALATDERGRGVLVLRGERAGTCRVLLSAGPADVPCADPRAPGSAWAAYDDADALGYWAGAGALAVRVLPDDWHLDRIPREKVGFDLLHREVFAYYEQTSTFMRSEVFSLADRCKVETYAELVWQMCDPRNKDRTYYMPPTRDLTDPKARLLLAYLRNRQALARPPLPAPAAPAAPPPITTRGRLHTVLRQAATLELAVMLQYLYAAFSVPTHGAGLAWVRAGRWTPRQLELACGRGGTTLDDGIRGALLNVAREEMIHFLLVNNILMATGEPFHVPDLDFGTLNGQLPVPLDFALEGLGIASVQRYIAVEQPAGLTPELRREGEPPRAGVPGTAAWGSVSELYAAVREGLRTVPGLFLVDKGRGGGEHHVFMRESVNTAHPDYQLEVDDLSSALFAVDFITEQGEGGVLGDAAPSDTSHFETFLRIGELLTTERVPGPHGRLLPWDPAYPVLRNPTLGSGDAAKDPVTDPAAREVARLFNRSYALMLHLMVQHFGTGPDTSLRRSKLMNASIDVMTGMMRPLGELLVTMDSGRRGRTAGPTFELDAVPAPVPRPDVARRALALRCAHLAAAARACAPVPEQVAGIAAFYAEAFGHEER
ncbi:VioB - polyketide synthase [Streptomyces sp. AV19]|uniref:ferritin-like domain-containing protein n=1 Tax=Streptomyces sp. AV19 TaxID=2793068 RepID=UPI0018FE522F|nr:ferritin-like domain-containing protein [Streptomyces sp. AV19]MBH1938226.1 VioB - polyketide synthase [Streptomyces sp. AV19]MDG4534856.1 VioB - polyketide synthase [Streptomyces sp. AV19]